MIKILLRFLEIHKSHFKDLTIEANLFSLYLARQVKVSSKSLYCS